MAHSRREPNYGMASLGDCRNPIGFHAMPARRLERQPASAYEPLILALTLLNVLFVAVPSAWMAMKQTRMIRASMMAYSTAVGPSSETRKCLMPVTDRSMMPPQL